MPITRYPPAETATLERPSLPAAPARVTKPLPEPPKSKGIFDKYVAEIVKDARYLTADNIVELQRLLPVEKKSETTPGEIDLTDLLDTLMKLQKRMQLTGLTSNDPAEIKQMIGSTKVVIDLVRKHQEGISEQARQLFLENAIVEVLDELEETAATPEVKGIKARFLALFQQKLANPSTK